MVLHEWLAFIARFLNIHRSGVLTALAWLVPHETAAVSAQVLCTPYSHAPCHFMQSHIRKVYAFLAVTCHLHFWQNDRDLLGATVVTRGWNGYRNKSQHRKSTLEKKILPPFQQGFEPATFQSRVRRSNHWAIPAPVSMCVCLCLSVYVSVCLHYVSVHTMCPQPTHGDPGLDLGEHGTLHTTDHNIRVLVDTEHVRIVMSVTTNLKARFPQPLSLSSEICTSKSEFMIGIPPADKRSIPRFQHVSF